MVSSSSSGWSHAFSQSAASNSATNQPSIVGIHPSSRSDFLRHIFHNLHSLLPPHLIFFRGIFMHALQSLQVVLLNKAKILAQQSPLHFLILYIFCFFVHASIPAVSLCLCGPLFCCPRCPRPCTCPELLPPFFLPNSSSIDPSPLGSKISVSSFLLCLPPKKLFTLSFIFSVNHHHLSSVVPQTVWCVGVRSGPLFFSSWSERCPMSIGKYFCVRRNF